jgi:preprotein translocase subunit SecF
MNYKIIQKRNIWLTISALLFIVCAAALIFWGLKFGIDFTGGSMMEVKFLAQRPQVNDVYSELNGLNLGSLTVQPVGESNVILRFQESGEGKQQAVMEKMDGLAKKQAGADQQKDGKLLEEISYNSVGPSIGKELKRKSITAIFWVFAAIVTYISIAFRKVSKPVTSWMYGISALVAMLHDVVITIGIFAILGKLYGVEINTPFVAAALTVIGYSVHDTIVVFDRLRENITRSDEDFEGTVNSSINQTLGRSISTSMTTLLALTAILLFGGASIKTFALALTIGIFIGTYSSIFVASPLLVVWEKFSNRD